MEHQRTFDKLWKRKVKHTRTLVDFWTRAHATRSQTHTSRPPSSSAAALLFIYDDIIPVIAKYLVIMGGVAYYAGYNGWTSCDNVSGIRGMSGMNQVATLTVVDWTTVDTSSIRNNSDAHWITCASGMSSFTAYLTLNNTLRVCD